MMKCQRSMALSGKGGDFEKEPGDFLILGCFCGILRLFSNLPAIIHIFNTALTLHCCTEKYIFHTADRGIGCSKLGKIFLRMPNMAGFV